MPQIREHDKILVMKKASRPRRVLDRVILLWILSVFIAVPLVEVGIFIEAGRLIGTVQTIALVFMTGIVGGLLVRMQGAQAIYSIKRSVEQGRLPANEIIEGLFVLVGGALLLTPGFFTDLIGLLMLLPATRKVFREFAKTYFRRKFKSYMVIVDAE